MFTRITRSGGRAYLQLVESFRNEAGQPRQRVIANLGRFDQLTDKDLDPLINGLQRALGRTVEVPSVAFDSSRSFGDLFALHELWQELGLDRALRRALRSSRRQFDAGSLVRAMVFNRLCEPTSKLGVLRWLETVSLPDAPEAVTHDQLLRSMDALMDHIDAVEKAVAAQLRPLLDQSVSIVFYDLTTVRIHGEGTVADDVRAFGLNKETRGIARQFVLGVIQTAEGLPIAHEVHAGNVGEVSTLLPAIEKAIGRYRIERVVLVADRGLLSLDNLEQVEQLRTVTGEGVEYILAVPARRYGDFGALVADMVFDTGVGESTWEGRRLVVAHDPERAAEQGAKRRRLIEAIEAEGERMARRLDDADDGKPLRGRKSSDRKAYLRFCEQVKDASLSIGVCIGVCRLPRLAGRGYTRVMDFRVCLSCGRGEAPPAVRCSVCGAALELRDENWLIGQALGNYRIERVLGSGGMGVVFGACHQILLREAAVKVLHPGLGSSGATGVSDGDAFGRRFLREARLLATLDHPGIVGIYDFDISPFGFPYLVMPLLRGETLRGLLDRHRQGLPWPWITVILQDLATALTHAHAHGVVHRDLKPENVFLVTNAGQAHARLLDFGIAHGGAHEALDRTATGVLMGTPRYLAPEQLRGEAVSPATDQYSLALLVIELLCGRALRADDSLTEIVRRYARDVLPEAALPDGLAPTCRQALLRATDPQPQARFPDLAEFVIALALPAPDREGLAAAMRTPPERIEDPALATAVFASAAGGSVPPITPLPRATPAPLAAVRTGMPMRAWGAVFAILLVALLAGTAWWFTGRARDAGPASAQATSESSQVWLRAADATPLAASLEVLLQADQTLVLRQPGGWALFDLDTATVAPGVALALGERLLGADDVGRLWLLRDDRVESIDPIHGTRRLVAGPDPALRGSDDTRWVMARSGRWLARVDPDRFTVLRVANGAVTPQITGQAGPDAVIALGDRLAVVASPRRQLEAWELESGERRWSIALPAFRVQALALDEDFGRVALATEDQVQVHQVEDGLQVESLAVVAQDLLWFADGPRLLTANPGQTGVWQWREGRAVSVQQLATGGVLFRGDVALFSVGDGYLRRYDFGHAPAPVDAGVGQVWAAIADAEHFYVGGSGPAIARLAPGEAMLQRQVHEAGVPDLRIYENRLISSSDDRTLAVWRLPELELQWRAKGHAFFVNQIGIGASLWSASSDGSLRRWRWPELEPDEDIALRERLGVALELHGLWVAPDDSELLLGTWNDRLLRLRREGEDWALASAPFEAHTGYRMIDLPAVQAVLAVGIRPGRLALYARGSGQLSDLPRDGRTWHAAVADASGAGAWLGGDGAIAHLRMERRADGRFELSMQLVAASAFKRIGAIALRPATPSQPALLLLGNDAGEVMFLPPPAPDGAQISMTSSPPRVFSPHP